MKTSDFNDLEVLMKGYRMEDVTDDGGVKQQAAICIYCETTLPVSQMQEHMQSHTARERLEMLVHADSVFDFNAKEKRYIARLFEGDDDKKIGEAINIPYASSRRMRSDLVRAIRKAKGLIALEELLGGNLERQKRADKELLNTEIPVLDGDGCVSGFCKTKRELHRKGLLHPTTLIVAVKKDPVTDEPAILLVDKANINLNMGCEDVYHMVYDVLGGHVRMEDFLTTPGEEADMGSFIGRPFPFERVMDNCARRELGRELVSPRQSDDSLVFWFDDRYEQQDSINKEEVNNEITRVYLCRYRDGGLTELNAPGAIRVKDDWLDSLGRHNVRVYTGRFFLLADIKEELKHDNVRAMDGLLRVLKAIDGNPAVKAALWDLVN